VEIAMLDPKIDNQMTDVEVMTKESAVLKDFKTLISQSKQQTLTKTHDAFITELSRDMEKLKISRDFPIGLLTFQQANRKTNMTFAYQNQLDPFFTSNPALLEFRNKNYAKEQQWERDHKPKNMHKPSPIKDVHNDYFGRKSLLYKSNFIM
jgi:hypothetical protein